MVGLMKYHQSVPVEAFSVSLSLYIHTFHQLLCACCFLSIYIYIYIYTKFLSVYTHLSVVTGWSFVESPCQKIMIFMKKPWKREGSTIKKPYQIMTNFGGIPPN